MESALTVRKPNSVPRLFPQLSKRISFYLFFWHRRVAHYGMEEFRLPIHQFIASGG